MPPVWVNVPVEILPGEKADVVGCDDSKIILPAVSPAAVLLLLVLMLPTVIALLPVPPDEINTLPPCELVLVVPVAELFILPLLMAPEETRETGPASPFVPVAVAIILPVVTVVARTLADEFTTSTIPALAPEVLI